MNRRTLLTGAPAAVALCAAPALAETETPIMQLYRLWLVKSAECNKAGIELPEDDVSNAIYDKILREVQNIEGEMYAIPPQTAQDFVAKVIAWTDHGMRVLPDSKEDPKFWAEARAMLA